jgi:hypothetical protein
LINVRVNIYVDKQKHKKKEFRGEAAGVAEKEISL